jgi:hypothetical protein
MEPQIFQIADRYIIALTADSTPFCIFQTEQEAQTYLASL